jgi:hypothetical protein
MAAVNGQMSDADSIETATRRLALALDALEAAAERRSEAARGEKLLANQVHALGTDRARLAGELDEVTARARTLETANRQAMQRIDRAIETIRDVLAQDHSEADDPAEENAAEAEDDEAEGDAADE